MANTFNIVWSGPKLDGKLDYTNAKSAKEAWNTLKLSYKGVDKAQKAKLQSFRREYERYEMSSLKTVEQYFTRVTDLINKMRVYGEDMPDSKVVEKILRTMPMKYDHMVTTILESHDMDTMMITELQGTMESHISRILEKSERSTKEALKKRVNLSNVAESSRTQEGRGRGFNLQNRDENIWYLDNACSNHMSGRKEFFSSLDDSVKLLLKFGNSTKIPIEAKGHIPIRLKDGSLSYISDVYYAPKLDYNLLSMGQLSEKGYKMITYHGYYTVFDNNGSLDIFIFWPKLPFKERLVSGLPQIHISNCICEICQLEKKHRDTFPTGKSWRARRLLEIVHSDLCSVEVPSNDGSRDVTFDEKDIWDWNTKTEEQLTIIPNTCDEVEERQPDTTEQPESSRRSQREQRLPARLADYEVGNNNDPSDEEIINFALFSYCEPLNFEEASKDNTWKKAMD
ncbi:uncharacterized protein [Arachis hypogaea]|uniref:uncharacterized protein n=1 Tax=Arachis hypogaea TaxID=3818 RepID=UPI003B215F68